MILFYKTLTVVLFMLNLLPCYSCSCGRVSIDREVKKAYDFVVGRIGEERENYQDYKFNTEGVTDEASYSYFVNVGYSFKDKIKGAIVEILS